MGLLYFEDLYVGRVFELGSRLVEREELLDFAKRWDPQPIHVDQAVAEASMFKGLTASGWHTASIMAKLSFDGFFTKIAFIVASGVDELRWHRPVRPGDLLTGRIEVTEAVPSSKDPARGVVRLFLNLLDSEGSLVYSARPRLYVHRRVSVE